MYIYKITNKINQKMYIGQTINPIEERFHRHIQDAMSGRLDTHFARAIRYYKPENFKIELIDTATSQEELTQKEHYWINFYDAVNKGYNETNSITKSGGNTYLSKTSEELTAIKEKIRQTKLGGKNPNATKVKCKNMQTNEEFHFGSISEMQNFIQAPNHTAITRRCNGKIRCLFNGIWAIAYENNEYNEFSEEKMNRKSVHIKVIDLGTNEEKEFISYASAERYYGLSPKYFSGHAYKCKDEKIFVKGKYKIIVL